MKEGIDCGYTWSAAPSSVAPLRLGRSHDLALMVLGWQFRGICETLAQIFRGLRVKSTY